MSRTKSPVLGLALFLAIFLMAGAGLFAQTATLSGTVTDPQDAVVPGATITLTNTTTGTERSTVSDDQGRYLFAQVSPGVYNVKAELPGFKTVIRPNVRLLVDTSSTMDLKFSELGEVSELVTVTAASEKLINKTDSSVGNAFNELQIVNLPIESRNVVDLLSLQPGVTKSGYVTGSRSDQSNLMLDGVDVNEQQTGEAFTPVLRVTPDSISEFRVTVSNPNANQGRSAGAEVSLVTKSGTNAFHGSLYEFHRNTVTTANDFFNNRSGVDRPRLLRNLFGGSIGGPILKDKAFFFFNYERRTDRSETGVLRTVPLPSLGNGLISYENTSGQMVTLNTDQLNAIYPVGINPVAVQALKDAASKYPANDNGVGDGVNTGGFRFNAATPLNNNTYIARVDLNLSDNMQFFVRGNYQWDTQVPTDTLGPQQFPDTPQRTVWSHPTGIAVGNTWMLTPSFLNRFTYGLTREAFSQQGDSSDNDISFRFVFSPRIFRRTLSRSTPVHNFADDVSWVKGNHTWQFGTNIRLIDNNRVSFSNAFDNAITNPSFYDLSGAVLSNPIDDLAAGSVSVFQNAVTALIGRYSQYQGNFTFGADGSLLSPGTPTLRDFATNEFDFYFQDTWQMFPTLTVSYGLRWGVNTPVSETSGFEVKPTTSLTGYFEQRKASAAQGVPFNDPIQVDLAGPFYGKPGFYPTDWNNFAPRISAAWSPNFDGGILKTLFGSNGATVFRGGFAMLYDRIGSALAVHFDLNNTLGFTSTERISANTYNVSDRPAPQFTGYNQDIRTLPGINVPAALTFPLQKPSDGAQRIESSLDDGLTTPINYTWNFSIGRQFAHGFFLEASYLGRSARNLLATRDIMALNNLVDPESGMDWYGAARQLADLRLKNTPIDQVPNIPFFDHLFPGLPNAGAWYTDPNLTPTQNVYQIVARDQVGGFNVLDWTFAQLLIDDLGIYPNMFFQPQYGALSTFSTVAYSNYNAMTITVRERLRDSLTFDFNYTWSKSLDNASGLQTSTSYGSAFIENPLRPDDQYSVSDFNMKHIINANWLWSLPFGHGQSFLSDLPGIAEAFLGGWQFQGIFRWNSGLPQPNTFDRAQWATNWNVQSNGVRTRDPNVRVHKDGAHPNLWDDQTFAYQSYRNAFAGETGDRNVLTLDGFVSLDFGLYKSFVMPYNENHKVTFRWEVFNATNTQRLGAVVQTRNNMGLGIDPQLGAPPPTFGNINSIQGSPRVMQFGLRYDF